MQYRANVDQNTWVFPGFILIQHNGEQKPGML